MKILYATDGSEGGLGSARFFAGLPHQPDTHVHIVTVVAPDKELDNYRESGAILSAAVAALGGFAGKVTTETAWGSSTSEIVEVLLCLADKMQADLIAIGASGHSAVARFFVGSVAESVARFARQPVLVTRASLTPLRDVVVGVDGSDYGRAAATFVACRFSLPLICTLRLASVISLPVFGMVGDPIYTGTVDYSMLEAAGKEAQSKAHFQVEALASTLSCTTHAGSRIQVEPIAIGNPAAELMKIADEHDAGLIVVGSHGLSGIARFFLGSVSERVLRHAHCSVLIVKQAAEEPEPTHTKD